MAKNCASRADFTILFSSSSSAWSNEGRSNHKRKIEREIVSELHLNHLASNGGGRDGLST